MVKRFAIYILLIATPAIFQTQANFYQCDLAFCAGSANDDLMNGSTGSNYILGDLGDDVIFGGDGRDTLFGETAANLPSGGDDLIFGGLGSDSIHGGPGNDNLFPGPDDEQIIQYSIGDSGNDIFWVFVSETINCQVIRGIEGSDVLYLIGFGPYIADFPFGSQQPIAANSFLIIRDPVAGGYIFVRVESGPLSLEKIIGLPTPNVTISDLATTVQFQSENCINSL